MNDSNRPFLVAKFGGTSVANPSHWPRIRARVGAALGAGQRPLLVCSALAGVSDLLEGVVTSLERGESHCAGIVEAGIVEAGIVEAGIVEFRRRHREFAAALGVNTATDVEPTVDELRRLLARLRPGKPADAALHAAVLSMGEVLCTRIITAWLASQGVDVAWVDARDLLLAAETAKGTGRSGAYLAATCDPFSDPSVVATLPRADVLVTQGFIARNQSGETVLLGRGGSDTAAACLAVTLGAEVLEIWSDVPGMFTTNPRWTDRARLLPRLSYDEAETLAGMGAKVLHARCIHPLRKSGIPLVMRWIKKPSAPVTRIDAAGESLAGVRGLTMRSDLCLVSMRRSSGWQPVGFMAEVADCFRRNGVSMDLVSSSATSIRATIDLSSQLGFKQQVPALRDELRKVCDTRLVSNVASVTVVGRGLRGCLSEIAPVLTRLERIEPHMVCCAANNLSVSVVLPPHAARELLLELHDDIVLQMDGRTPLGPSWAELTSSHKRAAAPALAASGAS